MRLTFDNLTLGHTKNYGISSIQGLSGELRNINVEIPQSDYSRNITDRLEPGKVRTFSGVLVGDNAEDFRARKRELVNKLRKTYTFTLEDVYSDGGNGLQTYNTYEFEGKIITINTDSRFRNISSRYVLQIQCPDPLIYSTNKVTGSIQIQEPTGIHVPVYIPAQFGTITHTFNVKNTGLVGGYMSLTLVGGGSTYAVDNLTTGLQYVLNTTLQPNEEVYVDPRPSQEVNTIDEDGVSLESQVTGGYDTFFIEAGETHTFQATVLFNQDATTEIQYSFRAPFIGI